MDDTGEQSELRHAKRYMLSWLSDVCAEAREDAQLSVEQVAAVGAVSYSKVYKFEEEADRWPRGYDGIDRLLAAYAAAVGLSDHRELWVRAIDRWMRHHHRALTLNRGELVESSEGEIPAGVLRAMEEAIEAYAHEQQRAARHNGQAFGETSTGAASDGRERP